MIKYAVILSSVLFCSSVQPEEDRSKDAQFILSRANPWQDKLRVRALLKLDNMLAWAIPYQTRVYSLDQNVKGLSFQNELNPLFDFSRNYGYFSKTSPLVGIVTEDPYDTVLVQQLLIQLFETCHDLLFIEMSTAEILTKLLAYRQLEKGMKIFIPVVSEENTCKLVAYQVERIFDLWQGMPAFGLAAVSDKQAPSILLYRGTDFSMISKRSWASILSDLDITGPGLSAFQKARPQIHSWLKQMAQKGKRTKVMGFSLGGALSLYTLLYEQELIASKGSVAFNPPGISNTVFQEWKDVPEKEKPNFAIFINKGDIIPKLGKLVPYAYELSNHEEMRPIDAHVRLMTGELELEVHKINLEKENQARFSL